MLKCSCSLYLKAAPEISEEEAARIKKELEAANAEIEELRRQIREMDEEKRRTDRQIQDVKYGQLLINFVMFQLAS